MSALHFFHLNTSLPDLILQDINRLYFPSVSQFMSFNDLNIKQNITFVFRSRPGSLSFHDMTAFIMKVPFLFQSWLIRTKPEIIHQSRITGIFPASVCVCSQALSPCIVGMSVRLLWDQKKRSAHGFLPVSVIRTYRGFPATNPQLSWKTYSTYQRTICRYGSVKRNTIKSLECVETCEKERSTAVFLKYPAAEQVTLSREIQIQEG